MHLPGFTADFSLRGALGFWRAGSRVDDDAGGVAPQSLWWLLPPVAIGVAGGFVVVGGYKIYERIRYGPVVAVPPASPLRGCASLPAGSSCPASIGGVGTPCLVEGGFCTRTTWVGTDASGTCTTVETGWLDSSSLGNCKCKCV